MRQIKKEEGGRSSRLINSKDRLPNKNNQESKKEETKGKIKSMRPRAQEENSKSMIPIRINRHGNG